MEPTPVACRKKGKGRAKLTTTEKIDIVHQIINQHYPAKDVAKEFRITVSYVT